MNIGLRNLQATALLRDYRGQGMSFEIVDMNLEERGKLRRLLADNLTPSAVEETTKSIVASEIAAR